MRVDKDEIKLNVYKAIRHPYNENECNFLDAIIPYIEETFDLQSYDDATEEALVKSCGADEFIPALRETIFNLEKTDYVDESWHKYLELGLNYEPAKPSIEFPPTDLHMKPLLEHLKYAFLQDDLLPVIISCLLTTP